MTRRTFLAASAFAAQAYGQNKRLPIKKGVLLGMLPKELSYADRFKLAKDVGFEQMECGTIEKQAEAEEIKAASDKAGLPIHSVMNAAHWRYPLSSSDPQVVATSIKGIETSLRNAKLWGAETVLVVPAVVNAETSYKDAWDRSVVAIKKVVPLAQDLKVIIAIEEVWNKFLLSPLEMANYVDSFKSPWVKAYFDVGNVVLYGFPQDWIRTLGNRIVKLHLKDFRFHKGMAEFVPLREGDINWPEIYKALSDIGYRGTATVEVRGGGEAELREISKRVDLILEGAPTS
jgi:L-ribulose-5-phosphate 3-epimerase